MKIGVAGAFYITQIISVVLALECDPVFLLASDSPLCRCSSHSCDDLVEPPDGRILSVRSDRRALRFSGDLIEKDKKKINK
jgi:hypothetical protein